MTEYLIKEDEFLLDSPCHLPRRFWDWWCLFIISTFEMTLLDNKFEGLLSLATYFSFCLCKVFSVKKAGSLTWPVAWTLSRIIEFILHIYLEKSQ